ncbi:MAG: GNAT family N-acetyltransferase [Chloroflexi bacterium]|nr:GNAT family N-acetyltransferase [Chloroflexota bacterium]MBV9598281.1 GNAT family N-acetyltransferase [Chloroflexota bacterium]
MFDAAVRRGWTYLGDLVEQPLFTAEHWDQLVAEHQSPNLLLVAVDRGERVIGFTAVHPADGEMFLLFVHPKSAGAGAGRRLLEAAHAALREAGCGEAFHARALTVYAAAGYRPDGTERVTKFRGRRIRELRLVTRL